MNQFVTKLTNETLTVEVVLLIKVAFMNSFCAKKFNGKAGSANIMLSLTPRAFFKQKSYGWIEKLWK